MNSPGGKIVRLCSDFAARSVFTSDKCKCRVSNIYILYSYSPCPKIILVGGVNRIAVLIGTKSLLCGIN